VIHVDTKTKLSGILREHRALTNQHRLEESKVKRLKENEAKQDTQAGASAPVAPSDGTPLKKDSPQNDGEIQKENEATQDTQTSPATAVAPADGTPLKQDAPQNDGEIQKESDDEELKESDDEEELKESDDRFKEMEDDMDKLVDVVEALKNQVDELKEQLSGVEERFRSQAEPQPQESGGEEPMEPMQSESVILRGALRESAMGPTRQESFGDVAKNMFR